MVLEIASAAAGFEHELPATPRGLPDVRRTFRDWTTGVVADDAIRADLQNTELLASFASLGAKLSPIRVTADPRAIVEEVTERITEELDYRIEAANQTAFRSHYDGHPFIRIPEVVSELSTERVLVMDHHDGLRWTAALTPADGWGFLGTGPVR